MLKERFAAMVLVFTFIFGFCETGAPVNVEADNNIEAQSAAKSFSSIKLRWNKLKGRNVEYRIYRSKAYGDDGKMNPWSGIRLKKIATVRNKSSFTDKKLKKKKYYYYEIRAYKKKNGKKKKVAESYAYNYTGVEAPEWSEYIDCDYDYSPRFVDMEAYGPATGVGYDGYEIYRRQTGGKFKRIKKIKSKKYFTTYRDKSVDALHSYEYRVRCYKKIKKKTYYSKYSNIFSIRTCNSIGGFDWSFVAAGSDDEHICIRLESEEYNGRMSIPYKTFEIETDNIDSDEGYMTISKMSRDGETWSDYVPEECSLDSGETIYLLMDTDPGEYDRLSKMTDGYYLSNDTVYYNGRVCRFFLASEGGGSAYIDLERYH